MMKYINSNPQIKETVVKEMTKDYIKRLNHDPILDEIADKIDANLFEDPKNKPLFEAYAEDQLEQRKEYKGDKPLLPVEHCNIYAYGGRCFFKNGKDFLKLVIDIFGPRSSKGPSNNGLEWLADLQTGGDGSIRCDYVESLPPIVKHKLKEYEAIIQKYVEDSDLELLGPAKPCADGFYFPVLTEEYKEIMNS